MPPLPPPHPGLPPPGAARTPSGLVQPASPSTTWPACRCRWRPHTKWGGAARQPIHYLSFLGLEPHACAVSGLDHEVLCARWDKPPSVARKFETAADEVQPLPAVTGQQPGGWGAAWRRAWRLLAARACGRDLDPSSGGILRPGPHMSASCRRPSAARALPPAARRRRVFQRGCQVAGGGQGTRLGHAGGADGVGAAGVCGAAAGAVTRSVPKADREAPGWWCCAQGPWRLGISSRSWAGGAKASSTRCGARTHDHKVKSLALYRLS